MALDWMLSPLALYGTLAAGLIACLTLFITVKLELGRMERRSRESASAVMARIERAESAVARLREAVAEAAERPAPPASGLNLTRRAQALRMHQRGEEAATIAAALRAPRNEIELLIKLQEMQRQEI